MAYAHDQKRYAMTMRKIFFEYNFLMLIFLLVSRKRAPDIMTKMGTLHLTRDNKTVTWHHFVVGAYSNQTPAET